MWETRVRSLGWEDPLEKEMVTHSSILAYRISWTEEPGRLQSTGPQRVRHYWATSLLHFFKVTKGLPRWCGGKESTCQCRRHKGHGFYPWVGEMPWSMKWQPTPVFMPGKFHRQRNLPDYSLWGCKESDTTEWLTYIAHNKCSIKFWGYIFVSICDRKTEY